MGSVFLNDWIPLYCDDGSVSALVKSLARQGLSDVAFIAGFNAASAFPAISWLQFLQLYADLRFAGQLLDVQVNLNADEVMPPAVERPAAPSGLGTDGNGVWFSTPTSGLATLRWYVNGAIRLRREQDLATNRSVTLAELDAQPGDVVQVCVEAGGVVGWWARVTV